MILLCFRSGIFDVRCKNYLKLFGFVIVQLLEVAPRTACSLESAFFKGRHSCTQAPVFHPEHSTCDLILIGVSFERKLILPEKSSFLSFPLSDSSFPIPRRVPVLAPGGDLRGGCPNPGHPAGPSIRIPYPLAHPHACSVFLGTAGYTRTKLMGSHFKTVCASDFKIN